MLGTDSREGLYILQCLLKRPRYCLVSFQEANVSDTGFWKGLCIAESPWQNLGQCIVSMMEA